MESKMENKTENIMRKIKLSKVTLNCGAGTDQNKLERSIRLLELIGEGKAVKTFAKRRIPAFGLRPGLAIGCKITLRKEKAQRILEKLLVTVGNKLSSKQINPGSFAFGIKEYIEIPGLSFKRDIGILGFDVCVALERAGKKVKEKKIKRGKIPKRQKITKEETIQFIKEKFNLEIN